ncbi:MAG: glycine oxidase ThiO [Candidatus Poribacteria bacterium]|nr:glycine oxidase ThiO [Candidatus Poribacteria bacterium]
MGSHNPHPNRRVIVIGGGVIGLSIGWRLAKAGCAVSIYERDCAGRSASWAAAGMLAPLAEVHLEEKALLRLGSLSLEMYPEWTAALEADSGMSIGYRTEGTLIVGVDPDDARELEHLYESQQFLNLPCDWLTGAEAREIEPLLSPKITAAISSPNDHQVDNRLMVHALIAAYRNAGGDLHEIAPVEKIEIRGEKAYGVWVDGVLEDCDVIVLAAGCWSSEIEGLPRNAKPPLRPVKGQILSLQMKSGLNLQKVLRTTRATHPADVYLVPKHDGRLVVGATSEEMGFDTRLTAGGIFELLRGAWEAVPGVYDLPIVETWTGLRPGSRDNAPILGATAIENLVMATGHYRHGILLAPVTAREIASLVLTGKTSEIISPFQLSRFAH